MLFKTGQCFQDISNIIENMRPIEESWTLHVGARDLDPEERELLESTEVLMVENITLKKKGIKADVEFMEGLEWRP